MDFIGRTEHLQEDMKVGAEGWQVAVFLRQRAGSFSVSVAAGTADGQLLICLPDMMRSFKPSNNVPPQELIELINRRRPMGTPVLKHLELPHLMVGDESFSE